MAVIPLVDYNTVLKQAQDYYEHRAVGDYGAADECLTKYFNSSNMLNPCVARMGLQQAQNDVYMRQITGVLENEFDLEEYKQRRVNLTIATADVNHDSRLSDLEHRIRNFTLGKDDKPAYSKSFKKRLALVSCILDNEATGLSSVRYKRDLNGKIIDPDQAIESKMLKKFSYLIRRLFTK